MALLSVFSRLLPAAKVKVAYYHHGPTSDQEQAQYRGQAMNLIRDRVVNLQLDTYEFVSEQSLTELTSESQMRDARWAFLNKLRASDRDIVVTGHHLGDHFETMMLKMIRGTSLEGVSAFKMLQNRIFRPLLNCTKGELVEYATDCGVSWLEDPSNKDDRYLRNWLRETWIPSLDARVAGGSDNLARSLFKIVTSESTFSESDLVFCREGEEEGISRVWYLGLTGSDQNKALALFLKKHQIYEFTAGHLEEIRKRLDKNQKDFTFEILRRKWVINASQIMLR